MADPDGGLCSGQARGSEGDGTESALRARVAEIVFGHDTRAGKAFDVVLIAALLARVAVVMLETVGAVQEAFGPAQRGRGNAVDAPSPDTTPTPATASAAVRNWADRRAPSGPLAPRAFFGLQAPRAHR